jgi:hypothetical protein
VLDVFKIEPCKLFAHAGLSHYSLDLCLLSSSDYRDESPASSKAIPDTEDILPFQKTAPEAICSKT